MGKWTTCSSDCCRRSEKRGFRWRQGSRGSSPAWIALGRHVPRRSETEAGTAQEQIARALDALGTLGTAIALSFTAYLIGSLIGYVPSTALGEGEQSVARHDGHGPGELLRSHRGR